MNDQFNEELLTIFLEESKEYIEKLHESLNQLVESEYRGISLLIFLDTYIQSKGIVDLLGVKM